MTASFSTRWQRAGSDGLSPRRVAVAAEPLPRPLPVVPPLDGGRTPSAPPLQRHHLRGQGRPEIVRQFLQDYRIGIMVARRVLEEANR